MASTPHIQMAVINDLVTDQRVHRSCMALTGAGYDVTLIGRKLPESLPVNRPYETVRMRLLFRKSVFFYAEYNIRLFFKFLFSHADLFYANDTDTLLACFLAAKLKGKPVFFDAHELFPEVPELLHHRFVRRFWETLERMLIPRVDGAVTVCQSIAGYYQGRYGVTMQVVRNLPYYSEVHHGVQSFDQPTILYQGAVNKGRGLLTMVDAMEYLENCHFLVIGDGDILRPLRRYTATKPWHDRITFQGRMEPQQLMQITPKAALGYVVMDNLGLNYYYSLPNRIGDCIHAHVPVLASDFPEIRNLVNRYQIGRLVPERVSAKQLAEIVRQTIQQWEEIPVEEKQNRFEIASKELCWQNESRILLEAVSQTMGN